jgi:N-acylneuraminate cytidylyltransferase
MYTAVIPVRAGSTRVKDKNIRPFAGSNLLIHKIRQLKAVPDIDSIVVSSDSDEMLEMARAEGVATHKRSWEYCDEKTASFGEVVKNVAENVEGEHLLWVLCTAPCIMPEHYSEAIKQYKDNILAGNHDSLITVQPFKKYLWDDAGPVNFKAGVGHVPSQQLPQYYMTTGLRIAPRQKMIGWTYFTGNNPYKYLIPALNCVDIDEESDLVIAETVYNLMTR